jgi:hypothetical protein
VLSVAIALALAALFIAFGISVLLNIGGITGEHARYLQNVNRALLPAFRRIPPWSFLIARGILNPDKRVWMYRLRARTFGLMILFLGVLVIVAEARAERLHLW